MPGTKEGALKGRDKRLASNPNVYSEMGKAGAEKSTGKFKKGDVRAIEAGRRGGKVSRKGKTNVEVA